MPNGGGEQVAYRWQIDGSLHGRRLGTGGVALIADVQFADASKRGDKKLDDRPGRMYSQTLSTFHRSMEAARSLRAGSLILLGDQVDDRDRKGDLAAAKVLESADEHFPAEAVGYLLGNHDTKWTQMFRNARERGPVPELPRCFAWECEAESEDGGVPWAIIALDCYATSFEKAPGWGEQLSMNGEVGAVQLAWLARRLQAAQESGKHVVVLSHVPLNPNSSLAPTAVGRCDLKAPTNRTQAVADHVAVRRVLEQAGNVRLCIAGHDHPGAFWADEEAGIHYWTERACLFIEGPPEVTGVVLRLHQHEAVLHVLADDSVHRVPCPSAAKAPPRNLAPPAAFDPPALNDLDVGRLSVAAAASQLPEDVTPASIVSWSYLQSIGLAVASSTAELSKTPTRLPNL